MTIVPYQMLSPQALGAVVEDFITREGAIHGHREVELSDKIEIVMDQLRRGAAVIVFDELTESCSLSMTDRLPLNQTPGQKALDE